MSAGHALLFAVYMIFVEGTDREKKSKRSNGQLIPSGM